MKVYWLGKDNENRKYIKRYAAVYKTLVTDGNDIITVTDDEGKLAGFSALSVTPAKTEISFFLVLKEYRNKGYGRYMLGEIEKALRAADVKEVRAIIPGDPGYRALFSREGYDIFDGSKEYMVRYGAFRYSDTYSKHISGKDPRGARSLKDLSAGEMKLLGDFFKEKGIPSEGGLDKELSAVCIEDGKIKGFVLCEKKADNIIIDMIYSSKKELHEVINCFRLIDRIISEKGDEKKDILVSFAPDNERIREFTRLIAGDPVQISEITRETTALKSLEPEGHR